MPIIVELPDKSEVEFPDGMDENTIQAEVEKAFPQFARPIPRTLQPSITAPGTMTESAPADPLTHVPQAFPVQGQQMAAGAKEAPPTAEEAEEMLMTPQVTIPKGATEGAAAVIQAGVPGMNLPGVREYAGPAIRGGLNVAKGFGEFATAPGAAPIAVAQLVPGLREVVDSVLAGSMVKSGAQTAGEASVTGDREKMTEGIVTGVLGVLGLGGVLAKPQVIPAIQRDIAARPAKPPPLLKRTESELQTITGERKPDAIPKREAEAVPLEEPPGNRPQVVEEIREQTRPDDAVAKETPPEIQRDVSAKQPFEYLGEQDYFKGMDADTVAKMKAAGVKNTHLFNLTEDVPGVGVKGSTVAMESLEKAGFKPEIPKTKLTPEQQAEARADLTRELGEEPLAAEAIGGKEVPEKAAEPIAAPLAKVETGGVLKLDPEYAKEAFNRFATLKGPERDNYMISRALDPLDPMSGVFKDLLKREGYKIEGTRIRRPPPAQVEAGGAPSAPLSALPVWKISYTDLETMRAKRPFYKRTALVPGRTRAEAVQAAKSAFPEPRYGRFSASKAEAGAKADLMFRYLEEPIAPAPAAPAQAASKAAPSTDAVTDFSKSVEDVPTKSKTVSDIKESAQESQKLGVSAIPAPVGAGMNKVMSAIKLALSELRDIPKFTQFKESVNRWFAKNQTTSLEVRQLQKAIESRIPSPRRREAITNYLQTDGDVAMLDSWAKASKSLKRKNAYEDAKTLTPDEIKVAQSIRKLYDDLLTKAQAYDLVKGGIDNYVTQVWKRPLLGKAQFAQFASKLSANFKFGKQRTFENFFEGEQLGYSPVSKDISKLLGLYVSEMGKTIATRDFIKDLTTKKASDGRPLAAPSGGASVVESGTPNEATLVRPNAKASNIGDYKEINHPALQKWKWIATDEVSGNPTLMNGRLVLHPEIAPHVQKVLSRSAIKQWYESPATPLGTVPKALAQGLDNWQSVTKQVMLGFLSPFHHVQEGTHAIGHRVNPLWNLPKLDPSNPKLQRAMNHGLAIAGDNAAMANFREGVGAQKIFEKIPIVGKLANEWTDFLFHVYIPKLKFATYEHILERNKGRYAEDLRTGKVTIDDVEYLSAQQSNAAYGHLNYADIGRDPTIQHIARTLFLAPDFLEARTRFTGQALKGILGKEGREQLAAMAFLAGTFFVGARVLNKLIDDDYHFEEPFGVIHNGRLYTMRSVPEDIFKLFQDTRKFAFNRLSPIIGKGGIEFLTGKNWRGERVTPSETAQELAFSWVPIMLKNLPGVARLSPSQANRSVTAWESFLGAMGLHVSRHSPITTIYRKGAEFMKTQGVKEDRGTYPVSKYQQLRYALEDSDIARAKLEIANLSKEVPMNKVILGFRESLYHPFTKSQEMDKKFKASLDAKDKLLFDEAMQQRNRIWARFMQTVRSR